MNKNKHNLTQEEKEDIINKIKQGEAISKEYLYKMAEDDEDPFLFWNERNEDVDNTTLPFHSIEHIDEPRKEEKEQGNIFNLDDRGRQSEGWTNKLIWGDNKLILSSLLNGPMRKEIEEQGGIKLIYIDPPFAVGSDFSIDIDIGDEEVTKKPSMLEEVAYRDTWQRGISSYLSMMYERLKLIHQLLADDGSIYVHCDYRVSSYLRLLLDDIFGDNMVNEIIWGYKTGGVPKGAFARKHDTLFLYSKTDDYIFNRQYYKSYQKKKYNYSDDYPEYYDEEKEQWYHKSVCRDVWEDINVIGTEPGNTERTNFPTQKPKKLLKRIIKASSNEGDIVADFFCGSGTTSVAAEELNRKWISADLGRFAIHTTRKRMIRKQRELKKQGDQYRAFEVLNLGKYERRHFFDINTELPEDQQKKQQEKKQEQYFDLIAKAYRAQRVDNFNYFHAKKGGRLVHIGPIDFPITKAVVQDILKECKEKTITKADILGFDFEMGVQPFVEQEAREKGVNLKLKNIPREVFDKKAVEKGQVNFYDISYVEIGSEIEEREVKIELKDFVTSYTQDDLKELENNMRKRSSKVAIKNGNIIKVEKDKNGVIQKEVLTKEWTDWIDYWAVDFDYERKKEIIKIGKNGDSEEVWTGNYLFENEWQSFRTKRDRSLDLVSAAHEYKEPGTYKVAIRVVDILGQDTLQIVKVKVE